MPQQHLLGSSPRTTRPSYNTMDFTRDNPAPQDADKKSQKGRPSTNSTGSTNDGSALEVATIEEAADVVNATAAERKQNEGKKKMKRFSDKKKDKNQDGGRRPDKKRKRMEEPQLESPGERSAGRMSTPVDDQVRRARRSLKNNDELFASSSGYEGYQARQTASSHMSPYITTPKKTPVPLPQRPSNLRTTTSVVTSPSKQDVEVLVAETPPLRLSLATIQMWKAPIQPTQMPVPAPSIAAAKSDITADTLGLYIRAVSQKASIDVRQPRFQASLTFSIHQRKKSLNDEPRSQGYRRSGSVSSASSRSIKDAFKRIRTPTHIDGIQSDPFTVPASQNQGHDNNSKDDAATFHAALLAFCATVDFEKEKAYLIHHHTWRASYDAAGPLPCLHQATGCNSAKEKALRIVREDVSKLLTLNTGDGIGNEILARSVSACMAAENFLHCAVLTQMPVPAGKLEGIYSLFCPKYAESHVDKYSSGRRTLSLSRPLGFKSNTFTARLSLPPRPMAFTTRAFKVPVHAGFRTTVLTTSAEECELGLTVLGNGYVLLRMDLGLLLTGKKSERENGKGEETCMEFMGVKEKDAQGDEAVKWGVLEEVKTKYAGERGDKKGTSWGKVGMGTPLGAENTPTKKKRGRPSKAELDRRMMEKAKETAARGGF